MNAEQIATLWTCALIMGGLVSILALGRALSSLVDALKYRRESRHHSAEAYQQLADRQAFRAIVEHFDDGTAPEDRNLR